MATKNLIEIKLELFKLDLFFPNYVMPPHVFWFKDSLLIAALIRNKADS